MSKVVIFTRGGIGWGRGHLHRSSWVALSLLNAGYQGLSVEIRCLDTPEARQFTWNAGLTPEYYPDTTSLAQGLSAGDVVVVDWLDSSAELVLELGRAKVKVLLLDDYGDAQQHADVVVNSLLAPLKSVEDTVGTARVLSGAPWLHLPPEALKLRGVAGATTGALATELVNPVEISPEVHCILVSFGGSAVDQATVMTLEALGQLRFGGKVLVMPGEKSLSAPSGLDVDFLPPSDEFHGLLAASDMAILGGGLSLYEAAFFGVPSLCIALNEHQQETAWKLERAGCCRNMGLLDTLDADALAPGFGTTIRADRIRRLMSRRGSSLFDGQGVSRSVDLILELLKGPPA